MNPSKTLLAVLCGFFLLAFSSFSLAGVLRILAPDLPGTSEPGGKGRDAETVKRVLQRCGYEAKFLIQPFGRHIFTYRDSNKADAVMTVPLGAKLPGYSTAAYIWYQNGAIYDANRIPPITTVDDLRGRKVVTFKNGIELLELEDFEASLGSVLELSNQRIHSHLLMLGRVDAILADGLIVAEINRRILTSTTAMLELDQLPDLKFAPIFTPTPYKLVFRDPSLAEAFDRCFDQAYADGLIMAIDEKYIGRFQRALGYRYLGF
ncbi:substrate-binding periplasmic protein [Marinobacter similis]|uniref:ABC transporter substrate-binding protein n=1 Tax=Marinobacter similis TaxID=1420916 RepID=W5YHM7_9GAMM|nr:transporter substrate-binding domain-containing protein [Marinobacter similis]AHI28727.1 ABC transporter substrate-binding protein [Marinobacter similis]